MVEQPSGACDPCGSRVVGKVGEGGATATHLVCPTKEYGI